ncbi:MAG: enoyl-CoA hydratase/isomerase family protein [Planctomycetia bacterium]|nr:enoyl-CoA hydratase/isomerase family protein [Planctomycetia bacterium]
MSELVTLSKDGDIAVITINNPPVNALSPGVPEGIVASVQAAQKDGSVKGIVLVGGGRTFIAGADIKEFGKITSGQKDRNVGLHPVLQVMEDCPKPIVCAIHGTAFGGGLETAMACHYRVAVASAQVGQPECKLGIIPGAGGTQRLPRLAGVAVAAEMCAFGDPVPAPRALQAGIIDKIIDGDLVAGAVAYAREMAASGKPSRRARDLTGKISDPKVNEAALAAGRDAVKKRSRGLLAPRKAIDAVEAASRLPFDQGIAKEAELFKECLFSDQSKALIHVFFGERAVAKIPGISKDLPLIPIKRAAVVGGGTMGGGITMNYANAGIPVLFKEISQEALDKGLGIIKKNYAATVSKGRLTQEQMDQRMALIEPVLTYDKFEEADIIVEAVFEEMALKKRVFTELDKIARPDAILASNTSTLNIDEIASATSRPAQVIGHHFFSPANVMRVIEIVRGKQSSPRVIATSMALAKKLNKVGILVGNCRGFLGNRMFHHYQREAQFLLEEGATVEQVDAVLYDYGMAMGPLAVGDLAGLDVSWRIRKEFKHLDPPGIRVPLVSDQLCELGRYGQKTGAGWYRYEAGNRTPLPDPQVQKIIEQTAAKAGIKRRAISTEEILERTLYSLVNEGANILAEGIALRAVDIDMLYILGYGYPAYRGGPMWYADTVGLKKVYAKVCEFEKQHGSLWAPSPLLKELAESGKTFADFDKSKGE